MVGGIDFDCQGWGAQSKGSTCSRLEKFEHEQTLDEEFAYFREETQDRARTARFLVECLDQQKKMQKEHCLL